MENFLYMFLSGACFGALVGMAAEAARWRRNADTYMRIKSKGKLFKVHHDSYHPQSVAAQQACKKV